MMTKNLFKKGSTALSLILAFVCLASCNTSGSGNSGSGNSGNPTEKYTPVEYSSNGESITDYKIVVAKNAGPSILYAADRLQYNLKQSLDVELPIVTDETTEGEYEILIGQTSRNEDDNIDYSTLGKESYVVKTVGKDLVIAGNERGSIYGTYAYLEALGFRFFTEEVSVYPMARKVFVPSEMELTWEPTFRYRESLYHCAFDAEWAVSQCINGDFLRADVRSNPKYGGYDGYVGGDHWTCHTATRLLPANQYYANHPEYYAEGGIDPCWSNEEAMEIMYQNVLETIDKDPNSTMISISMNDIPLDGYCQCDDCKAAQEEYGVSGWYFRRINWFAKKLQTDRPGALIHTLAYTYAEQPPKDLIMEENVIVQLCLTMCRWHTDPKECKKLQGDVDCIKTWNEICSELYIYSYPVNWANIFTRDADLATMRSNVRLFAENGVTGLYNEGYSKEAPEFSELKCYLHAKLMKNPWMTEGEFNYHIDDFMQGYYGDAAEPLTTYINESTDMIIQMQKEDEYHLAHWYSVDENFSFKYNYATHSFDMTFIDRFNELFDEAEAAVEGDEYERVRKSRIHWTYLEFYNTFERRLEYATEEEYEDLVRRNEELYRDIKKFGCIKTWDKSSELGTITDFSISVGDWW